MTLPNAHASKPWPDADRKSLTEEAARWWGDGGTWRRGEPCAECGWPFPNAPYHLHREAPRLEGPFRDD